MCFLLYLRLCFVIFLNSVREIFGNFCASYGTQILNMKQEEFVVAVVFKFVGNLLCKL